MNNSDFDEDGIDPARVAGGSACSLFAAFQWAR